MATHTSECSALRAVKLFSQVGSSVQGEKLLNGVTWNIVLFYAVQ